MQAIELLAEILYNAKVKVYPRTILTPAMSAGLRRGEVGKVQGLVIGGDGGMPTIELECHHATLVLDLEGEPPIEALKCLAALPCVFPEKFRRKDIQQERTDHTSRDGADLSLLGRFKQ